MTEPITLNTLWVIFGIILASGGVVFSAVGLFNTANDKITKIEGRLMHLETMFSDREDETSSLIQTIKDIQESLSDIRITQTEMRVTLSGVDGKNGLRGELRELKSELRELVNKM